MQTRNSKLLSMQGSEQYASKQVKNYTQYVHWDLSWSWFLGSRFADEQVTNQTIH